MKKMFSVLLFLVFSFTQAQEKGIEDSIKQVVITFFEGFHKQDTLLMKSLVAENVVLHSVSVNVSGDTSLKVSTFDDFLISIATIPENLSFKEKISDYIITVNGVLATVVAPYSFYVNTNLSHCGVNIFQLYLNNEQWKITYLTDSRHTDNCP